MMKSLRRSNEIEGFVNFPIDDPNYENTMEGGMFVRLVVEFLDEKFPCVCSGGGVHIIMDETYIGDDIREPIDVDFENCKNMYDMNRAWEKVNEYHQYHFPNYAKYATKDSRTDKILAHPNKNFEEYVSKPYLAAFTIGSTGWSGFNEKEGGYFICKKEHLNEQGLELYNLLHKLCPNNKIILQTWLDT